MSENKRVLPKRNCNCQKNINKHTYVRKKNKEIKEVKTKSSKNLKLFL
jgi:hypothetical protein